MAGTVTITEVMLGTVKKLTFTWTSTSLGVAGVVTTEVYDGRVLAVIQVPNLGNPPTNLYDVVVNDADGFDVLHGLGANLSNAADTIKTQEDKTGAVGYSKLTLAVSAAGDSNQGKTILFIR
ncbi:MAG: hypothetical protein IMY86_13975 [Chloroflexi bacterium]|nr:hypothetical protein [Chloroflexota bacterium]